MYKLAFTANFFCENWLWEKIAEKIADIFAGLLNLSLVEWATLSKVSMLKQDSFFFVG